MSIECWSSINGDVDWVLTECRPRVVCMYWSILDCRCLSYTWSNSHTLKCLRIYTQSDIWYFLNKTWALNLRECNLKWLMINPTLSQLQWSTFDSPIITGPKGNREFCFPETLNVPWGEAEGNIEDEGKQNSLLPVGPVILMTGPTGTTKHLVFCYTSQLKNRKKLWGNHFLDAGWLTNLPLFQRAQPDHVGIESLSCCFHRQLVSFFRPRELVGFDLRHVTRSPPVRKCIWVGRYNSMVFQQVIYDIQLYIINNSLGQDTWSLQFLLSPRGIHISLTNKGKVCVWAKWPIRRELIPVSVAWSD